MKKFVIATLVGLSMSLASFAAINAAPQKLSSAELSSIEGGTLGTKIVIRCEKWYWCGDDLCGSNCTISAE